MLFSDYYRKYGSIEDLSTLQNVRKDSLRKKPDWET